MTDDIFDELKTDVMMILTRESGHAFSERELYSKLLIERDIKDPIEKDNLKTRFLIIFRLLSTLYPEQVELRKINGVLKATFDPPHLVDNSASSKYNVSDETKDYLEEEVGKDQNIDMPSEISVIQFIVDEKLEKYYSKKDYDGNTILHKLVIYNDLERFERIYLHKDLSLFDKNNNSETPINLIKDVKFSNLLISKLLKNNLELQCELSRLKYTVASLDKEYSKLYQFTLYTTKASIFLFLVFFIKYFFA